MNIISGDEFESLSNFKWGPLSADKNIISFLNNHDNPIVYSETHNVLSLLNLLRDIRINKKWTLISHNSDANITNNPIKADDFTPIILENCRWYAQNVMDHFDGITPIPIGLERKRWNAKKIPLLINKCNNNLKKDKLIYINFNVKTNIKERSDLFESWKSFSRSHKDITVEYNVPYDRYLDMIRSHYYVLSPPGNGVDCHRVQECLYLRSIPVLLPYACNKVLYNTALIVDSLHPDVVYPLLRKYIPNEYNMTVNDYVRI